MSLAACRASAQAPPGIAASAEAVALPQCETAQVRLRVLGTGEPLTARLPVDLMLVLDRSGSIDASTLAAIKTNAKSLVDMLNSSLDRAGMVSFSTFATLDAPLTTNFANVKAAIDAIVVAEGFTNIGGGTLAGQTELTAHETPPSAVRVLVVLSDGVPNRTASGTSCATNPTTANICTQDAINQAAAAKTAGTQIYTIGLNLTNLDSTATQNLARNTLRAMASTPEQYFEALGPDDLADVFDSIANSVTSIAGTNVVVKHVLPAAAQLIAGSASPPPTTLATTPEGQTLTWQLGLINIGQTADLTFNVRLIPFTRNQLVSVYPLSQATYRDYQGQNATITFPETYVRAIPCSVCGDGIVGSGEECDDANRDDGDCCSSECLLDPEGTPCEDGLSCTGDDSCDGRGVCRPGTGGTASAGVYAVLGWSTSDAPSSIPATFGGRALVNGSVCAGVTRLRGFVRVVGDQMSLIPTGTAITFARKTEVAGSVSTAGGTINGSNKVTVFSGQLTTDGTAEELAGCMAAREEATARHQELTALPPDLTVGPLTMKSRTALTIPETGTLGPGRTVLRFNGDVRLKSYAKLTLKAGPTTERLTVQIQGQLILRGRAQIEVEGLSPNQVVFLVDGPVRIGAHTALAGTIWSSRVVTVGSRSRIDGAMFARGNMNPRSYSVVNRRPWEGWCDDVEE